MRPLQKSTAPPPIFLSWMPSCLLYFPASRGGAAAFMRNCAGFGLRRRLFLFVIAPLRLLKYSIAFAEGTTRSRAAASKERREHSLGHGKAGKARLWRPPTDIVMSRAYIARGSK